MEERNYKVYKHTCPNSKVYIGITRKKPKDRWRYGYGYEGQLFFKAIQKYGWCNIKHEILYTNLTKEEAEQKEIELISFYKSNQLEFGYNVDNGGNCLGKLSKETREKISKSNKGKHAKEKNPFYGKHHNEDSRKRMSISHKGQKPWNKGKSMSEETKKKISEANKGRIISEETRLKMSISNVGKHTITRENLEKMRQARKYEFDPWNKGVKNCYSNETIEKMRNAKIGKKLSEEHRKNISKANKGKNYIKVSQYDKTGKYIKTYNSMIEAAEKSGCYVSKISCCCKGKRKTTGGYIWKYTNFQSDEILY